MGFLFPLSLIVLEELSTAGKVGVGRGYPKLLPTIVIFI